jgi:hypothetical protein
VWPSLFSYSLSNIDRDNEFEFIIINCSILLQQIWFCVPLSCGLLATSVNILSSFSLYCRYKFRPRCRDSVVFFFFIWILEGGVHSVSTRNCGHYWPIVRAPGDCEDGEVGGMNGFGRGNRSIRNKPAPTPLCPPQIPLARPGREPGPPRCEASD